MDPIKVFPGELIFTSTKESIFGKVVGGTESTFLGYTIRQRLQPKLDSNFQPTRETYKVWEARWGNQSWFADTLYGIQMRVLELGGWIIGDGND